MNHFKTNGIYVRVTDIDKVGYYLSDGKGNLINKKYGLLDKLYDVFRHGKTMNIVYHYFYFKKKRTSNEVTLYHSSITGVEFTTLLGGMSGNDYFRYQYQIKEAFIEITDRKGGSSQLFLEDEGNILLHKGIVNGKVFENYYKFHASPDE